MGQRRGSWSEESNGSGGGLWVGLAIVAAGLMMIGWVKIEQAQAAAEAARARQLQLDLQIAQAQAAAPASAMPGWLLPLLLVIVAALIAVVVLAFRRPNIVVVPGAVPAGNGVPAALDDRAAVVLDVVADRRPAGELAPPAAVPMPSQVARQRRGAARR